MDITKLKFELYCKKCDAVVGYTDHRFKVNEAILASYATLPDGSPAKPGDRIECKCKTPPWIRSRKNNKQKT